VRCVFRPRGVRLSVISGAAGIEEEKVLVAESAALGGALVPDECYWECEEGEPGVLHLSLAKVRALRAYSSLSAWLHLVCCLSSWLRLVNRVACG